MKAIDQRIKRLEKACLHRIEYLKIEIAVLKEENNKLILKNKELLLKL